MRAPVLLALVAAACVHAPAGTPATRPDAVQLRFPGAVPLTPAQRADLQARAEELLLTSNFNSVGHGGLLGVGPERARSEHGAAVAGRHLTVTFADARTFRTVGGELPVRTIVVGLNRDDYADALFTVDPAGVVALHAKYSGTQCIGILRRAREIAGR